MCSTYTQKPSVVVVFQIHVSMIEKCFILVPALNQLQSSIIHWWMFSPFEELGLSQTFKVIPGWHHWIIHSPRCECLPIKRTWMFWTLRWFHKCKLLSHVEGNISIKLRVVIGKLLEVTFQGCKSLGLIPPPKKVLKYEHNTVLFIKQLHLWGWLLQLPSNSRKGPNCFKDFQTGVLFASLSAPKHLLGIEPEALHNIIIDIAQI